MRCGCRESRIVLLFETSDFYSTCRPAWLPAILSCFRQKEISFFRENIMPIRQSFGWMALSKAAFFFFDQNLAFAGVIGLPDDAFEFHSLHQRRSAVIPDLQPALNVTGGGLAVALDDCTACVNRSVPSPA